jgi:FMN reductase
MPLKLLGVSGSLRDRSTGLLALNNLLETARSFGAETRLLDLRTTELPMYNPDAQPEARIAAVREQVNWAQAFVLSSPDYHGSMSGAMKNFLDYHWHELSGKLFGFVVASHEKGVTVMEGMRLAVRQCYGWSLPYGVSIQGREDLGDDGHISNPAVSARLRMAARDMVVYGSVLYTQFQADLTRKDPDSFAARYA